ncbi:MAG: cobalt ECF transporter T component CbiQ [Desulfobulbaceae bacterium]|nr:MAG: cobalt ECF transporter T component CbiQ [Desulfobulbaceae bacterium]
MNFETFSTSSSFLHRLDARVKLLASLALVMVIALCRTFPTACAGLILALVLVMAARLSLKSVSKRLLLVNGFVLFLWFTLPLTYPGTTAFAFGPLALSREGLVLAALITIKTNATVLMLISLVATSSLAALGQALVRLKVPTKLCLLLLFSYRYIFVIHQEYLRLVRAARLRCFRFTTTLHTYRTTGYLFGMTLIKSHHRAQRVKQAMALRGFQGQFHTLYESPVGKNEISFALFMGIAVAVLITLELFNRIPA